ncbi:DUF541 domain-containing protein [Acidobacteria bacterium AB60]|nr:DUF541 domain-containing protein [Acidobacteria bacterium AB60]
MNVMRISAALLLVVSCGAGLAQDGGQPQLKIDSANRTLTVSANDSVSIEPEIAVLHIGFETTPSDAKSAYAEGSRVSNAIRAALKQAGVADDAIRSESQFLAPDYTMPKQHKFKLQQQWTVRVEPARAAEILDVAVTNGANNTGAIDWTVKDEKALEGQALEKAAGRVRENAATLARGMGVKLGALLYVSNQVSGVARPMPMVRAFAAKAADQSAPLAISPEKVERDATVYAVFAIE